jgi:hypothetical protein
MKTVDSEDEEEEGKSGLMHDVGCYLSDRHILVAHFLWLPLILNKILEACCFVFLCALCAEVQHF